MKEIFSYLYEVSPGILLGMIIGVLLEGKRQYYKGETDEFLRHCKEQEEGKRECFNDPDGYLRWKDTGEIVTTKARFVKAKNLEAYLAGEFEEQ